MYIDFDFPKKILNFCYQKNIPDLSALPEEEKENFSEFGARKILTLLVSTFVVDF